ncbi:hypothetical protein [Buttiauxella ferragutiae]|uniref:hypothetical protein n=1 Tax=Buttiauxella ferragutiae TaxID=82989 RepID=UPI003525F8AC
MQKPKHYTIGKELYEGKLINPKEFPMEINIIVRKGFSSTELAKRLQETEVFATLIKLLCVSTLAKMMRPSQ